MLSLQEAVSDEVLSVFGQRLLRSARNDALTLCHAIRVLFHSPKLACRSSHRKALKGKKLSFKYERAQRAEQLITLDI